MKIAVDARELHGQPTGVGRYLRGILDTWATLPEAREHEVILCAPEDGRGGTAWEQLALPRRVREAGADVLFAPGYTGPLMTPVPMVAAIYDVSFAAHPEWFGAREGVRRRTLTRLTANRAARIITTSQFSKGEIERRLYVDGRKVEVVYPGVPRPAAAASPDRHDAPTILFVGSLFNRRHVPELIAAFGELARGRPDVRLDIVGDNRTNPRVDIPALAAGSGAADRIALRAYVSDSELAMLYGRARAFAFLSEYEGFGLTPLEALAAGIPIVVLDTPIAREVYGDAALYVAEPVPALIRAALERALFDETERARVRAAAVHTLARYSWDACARQVLDILLSCRGSQ